MYLLGISAYYHDSAACLIKDGEIIAAAQEERFSRKKHDARFPHHAVAFCIKQAGIPADEIHKIVFYEKPLIKFERLLETYIGFAPKGICSFVSAIPIWVKEKLFLKNTLERELKKYLSSIPELLFAEHHQSHAASAFYPSPFENAAVLCMDGVGEWATTTAWRGQGNTLNPLWEIRFPHSLGLLYTAFTYYTGFKVNSGEYKVMGLAPYGRPQYVQTILDNLIDLKEDGSFKLNQDFFNYCTGLTMTNKKFDRLFGGPPRKAEGRLTQREMDLARSIQDVTEEVVLRLGKSLHRETGLKNLCMAGGVALNCVANGRLLREGPFEKIWIQPAAGDAGGALGAALSAWHGHINQPRTVNSCDSMKGSYLGPSFSNEEIEGFLNSKKIPYHRLTNDFYPTVARELAREKVAGWFQGRMEFGPRALGARSIIGDGRSQKMQTVMNLKIKYRESFRPFAPAVLREKVGDYFEMETDSPYMLLVAPIKAQRRIPLSEEEQKLWGIDLLKIPKSDIPAVTHVDYSARIQTVHEKTNPHFYQLIKEFEKQTGCAVLVNTSFNVRGEPIVCTPEDAYRCFMRTEMDLLILEDCILYKEEQPNPEKDEKWMKEFELD